MKKLLVALMLVCSVAHAGGRAVYVDPNGRTITLTNEECKEDFGRVVIATMQGKEMRRGCWFTKMNVGGKVVVVIWSDDTASVYETKLFRYREDK